MEKYSLSQAAKLAGVPKTTFHRWKEKDQLTPDVADDKGELTLYSEAQIEKARELYGGKATADKAECTCASGNDDSEDDSQAVAVVDARKDDGSNDDDDAEELPSAVSESAENDDALIAPPDDNGELPKSVTTPAQIDDSEVSEAPPTTLETAAEIVTLGVRANRIRQLQADVQHGIIEIGFELIAAKEEIGHGGWGRWLQNEFEWTERTARNFMAMAERFGNRKTFSDLKPSTLQAMLALPNGDETKFIDVQIKKGKPIEEMPVREVKIAVREWKEGAKESKSNTLSFEKPNVSEVKGEYLRVLPTAPTIEDAITSEQKPPIAYNVNSSVEYFTPTQYIEAARKVLGEIDLDPASCALANQIVMAKEFFSADNDGLQKEWSGRIWLNPPFANGLIEKFVDKLIASSFEAAIVLVDNATETRWFQKLAARCNGVVFTTGRINFLKEGTSAAGSPTRGQVFLYFGDDVEKFFSVFKHFGWSALVC